jgi:prepilin-type N-terminal cleavage/methylation domain-containing protein
MRELVKSTKKRQRGFTLVEVIIVVAIIGILSAIAVPNFISWLPNMRLKAASRDLYSHMMRAKMEAIRSNTPTLFNFTSGTGGPCTGGTYTFTNNGINIVNTSMMNDVCLSTPGAFPNGFSTRGTPSGAAGSIILTHPQSTKTYTITQTIAGGIRIQ